MFAPSKEYLYASYTYRLQNEKELFVLQSTFSGKRQPFQERSQLFPVVRVNLFSMEKT